MTARSKFLFDMDFGAKAAGSEKPPQTMLLSEHQAAVADSRQQGYREGFAAAQAEVFASAQRGMTTALERIANGIAGLAAELKRTQAQIEADAVSVAVAVATKLSSVLIAREPLAEITSLAAECLRHLSAAPHVVIRVNEAIYAEAREKLEALVQAQGFGGRLVVLAAPEIAAGDCRIEWADGGVVRERAATEAAIADAVERYLAARANGQPVDLSGRVNHG
jgi:flagellar assembly protein FliH